MERTVSPINSPAVIVPAYREAASIGSVVHELQHYLAGAEVVVIDDGSGDATAQVARAAGATVVVLPHNLGISAAVQTGYRYALSRSHDLVVRVDGDGQHDPRYIADLLAPLRDGRADMVVGSRFLGHGMYQPSLTRAIGIRFFSRLVGLVTGCWFTDTTSGFHACTADVAGFLASHMPTDYPEIEGLILLTQAGFRVREVPVAMRERRSGTSSIGRVRALYYVAKVTVSILIGLLRPRLVWTKGER